jgi:hypothetical protein
MGNIYGLNNKQIKKAGIKNNTYKGDLVILIPDSITKNSVRKKAKIIEYCSGKVIKSILVSEAEKLVNWKNI